MRPSLRVGRSWLVIGLAVLAASCAPLEHSEPFSVRNTHPAQLTALQLLPRSAEAMPAGATRIGVRHQVTSLWKQPGPDRDAVTLDGELYRLELRGRVGLGRGFDLEVAVPLLHASSGFLDTTIETWHRTFGLPQASRTRFPDDRFAVAAVREQPNGSLRKVYELEQNGMHVGDIPITLTFVPLEREDGLGPSAGLRAGLELPTGREDDGFGNGGLDASLGIVGSYSFFGWAVHAWASHSWVPTAKTASRGGLHTPNILAAGLATEAALLEELSGIVQLGYETAVLRELRASGAEDDQLTLWVGGRWRPAPDLGFELGVGEDLVPDVGPDVIFHFGLALDF